MTRPVIRLAARAYAIARSTKIIGRYPLRVQLYRPSLPAWPAGFGLRLVALADLHYGGPYLDPARLRAVLDATAGLEPDLVVLLGDYGASELAGESHRRAMRELSHQLSGLTAPLGTLAIIGNHDWWDDPQAQRAGHGPVIAAQELAAAGITVLENDAVALNHSGQAFWVAGLGDQLAHLGPPVAGADDLGLLTRQLVDDAPAILLAHEPDVFPGVPDRYALTLSGHTHGGQIKLFGRTPVVPSRFGRRYVHGHVVEGGRHLIVSAGLGTSTLPARIGVPPEIVLVELGERPPIEADRQALSSRGRWSAG